jgi:hypothetical protein
VSGGQNLSRDSGFRDTTANKGKTCSRSYIRRKVIRTVVPVILCMDRGLKASNGSVEQFIEFGAEAFEDL